MVYIHSFPSRFNIAAAVKANIGEAEEILANWSPDIAEAARALMLRVIVGSQCCSCEEIAAEEPPRLREWLEAWVEYAHTELRAEGDPDARPPAPPEKVDFPTPEVQANSIVVATIAQLARAAGHVEPRSRRPVVVRLPLPRREPVSRRLMARLARPEASRAPPHGNDDGPDSDDPDPDGTGANIIRALFRGRAMSGERLVLVGWKPMRKGTLVGVATVRLPFGLVIRECPVHTVHGKAWATLPAKPQIDKEGRTLRDERGKTAYVAVLEWDSRKLRAAFSDRITELVAAHDPHAFDDDANRTGGAERDLPAQQGGRP